jgi:transcriptional regulator with XRE-family HTH domain
MTISTEKVRILRSFEQVPRKSPLTHADAALLGPQGRLAEWRRRKNLTQEKLAKRLGVSVGAVRDWEQNGIPDIRLSELAEFYDVPRGYLLYGEGVIEEAPVHEKIEELTEEIRRLSAVLDQFVEAQANGLGRRR